MRLVQCAHYLFHRRQRNSLKASVISVLALFSHGQRTGTKGTQSNRPAISFSESESRDPIKGPQQCVPLVTGQFVVGTALKIASYHNTKCCIKELFVYLCCVVYTATTRTQCCSQLCITNLVFCMCPLCDYFFLWQSILYSRGTNLQLGFHFLNIKTD